MRVCGWLFSFLLLFCLWLLGGVAVVVGLLCSLLCLGFYWFFCCFCVLPCYNVVVSFVGGLPVSVRFLSSFCLSSVGCSAPAPGVVAAAASAAGASFLCVRPSGRSFSWWVCAVLFGSRAAASRFARAAAAGFGLSFCLVRRAGSWFSVSVPCLVFSFSVPAGSFPCLWCSLGGAFVPSLSSLCVCSFPPSSSVFPFSGVSSVGFSGSRSLSGSGLLALRSLLSFVPHSGCRVSVGCAAGADLLVRSVLAGFPGLLLFSVASGRFGVGRSAFARRSARLVRSVAAGSAGVLVVVPGGACPAGVVPSRSFSGGGSGSWGSAALALGSGRRVLLWLPSGCLPPSWSGVSWSSAGALGSAGCWWLGVPASAVSQLSLF